MNRRLRHATSQPTSACDRAGPRPSRRPRPGHARCHRSPALDWLLGALVDNQGNRSVWIDLRPASCPDPLVSDDLGAVAASAQGRSGSFLVLEDIVDTQERQGDGDRPRMPPRLEWQPVPDARHRGSSAIPGTTEVE